MSPRGALKPHMDNPAPRRGEGRCFFPCPLRVCGELSLVFPAQRSVTPPPSSRTPPTSDHEHPWYNPAMNGEHAMFGGHSL